MRIIFFGTPDYVIPVLEKLHKTYKTKSGESPIAAVVTQPPKPVGRKKQLQYSPVDKWAYKKDIKILRDLDIKNFPKAELGILASYGEIISKDVIDHFPKGILNIHFSLLPEFRGAAPIPAALVTGKDEAGVTIFKLDKLLDHGPVVSQFTEKILPADTTGTLMVRLFERSAEVLTTLVPAYIEGKITPRKQDHSKATYTRQITKEDAFINPDAIKFALQGKKFNKDWKINFIKDFTNHYSPITIHQFIRAMQPWPIAWTYVNLNPKSKLQNPKRLKILKTHLERISSTTHQVPSTKHKLVFDEVQLEGKNPVSWEQFQKGYPEAKIA